MTWGFVTTNDIKSMEGKGIDFNNDYPVFLTEFHNYLKSVWSVSYCHWITPLQNGTIEQFNANIGYPSNETYYMLDDSFKVYGHIHIMSHTSRILLEQLYGIHLIDD
tara:strand:- start:670 stop:990 length:321 start_codon:yes stop_codon:yes gene_type:complete